VRRARIAVGLALVAVGLAVGTAPAQSAPPGVVGLRLDGAVDPLIAGHLVDAIADAPASGASAIIIEMDTPGGLGSSMDQITNAILASELPVIGYVAPPGARAASAGAFILLACPVAAMAPGTNVGASTPVGISGGDLADKVTNDAAAQIRSLADTYGRNAQLAETFVTDGASITAEEALAGNVIDIISPDRTSLFTSLDGRTVTLAGGSQVVLELGDARIDEQPIGGIRGFLHGLVDPNIAFIFFWLGLALIVLELLIPGHIFSGTVGTAMLLVSLVSFGMLPVRIIGLVLLVFSVVAFVVEIRVPGLGLWGLLGVVARVLGGWWLYDPSGGARVSPGILLIMGGVVALFFGVVVQKAMATVRMPPAEGPEAVVGRTGLAIANGVDTRGGLVRIDAEEWQAVATGVIAPGQGVRVTRLDGLVLTVEPFDEHQMPAGAPASPVEEGGSP